MIEKISDRLSKEAEKIMSRDDLTKYDIDKLHDICEVFAGQKILESFEENRASLNQLIDVSEGGEKDD